MRVAHGTPSRRVGACAPAPAGGSPTADVASESVCVAARTRGDEPLLFVALSRLPLPPRQRRMWCWRRHGGAWRRRRCRRASRRCPRGRLWRRHGAPPPPRHAGGVTLTPLSVPPGCCAAVAAAAAGAMAAAAAAGALPPPFRPILGGNLLSVTSPRLRDALAPRSRAAGATAVTDGDDHGGGSAAAGLATGRVPVGESAELLHLLSRMRRNRNDSTLGTELKGRMVKGVPAPTGHMLQTLIRRSTQPPEGRCSNAQ